MVVKGMLECDDVDDVIILGAVITSETKHDEVVVAQSSRKIMDLGLEYGKPVGFGVTGPGMTSARHSTGLRKDATSWTSLSRCFRGWSSKAKVGVDHSLHPRLSHMFGVLLLQTPFLSTEMTV